MRTKQQKNNKKKLIIAAAVLVLAVASFGLYYVIVVQNTSNSKGGSAEDKTNSSQQESDIKDADPKEPSPESGKGQTNTDPQAPTSKNEETGKTTVSVVTSSNISNGTVYIRGGVNNTVSTDGTCYAQLIGPNGITIRKQTTLLQGASTTDCKTIQIPVSELAPGSWSYTLNYSSTSTEGVSNEDTFIIR